MRHSFPSPTLLGSPTLPSLEPSARFRTDLTVGEQLMFVELEEMAVGRAKFQAVQRRVHPFKL